MRLARELERRLERLVEGATGAVFRGRMHPVDIADRMIRQLEFLEAEGFCGPQIPNALTVRMSPQDLDPVIDLDALGAELARAVEFTSRDRGWRINGSIHVDVMTDQRVPRGVLECEGSTKNGPLPPWGQLIGVDGEDAYHLTDNRMSIGRAYECDITIARAAVSRQHLLVIRSRGGYQVADLGSSNGTYVNGERVDIGPTPIVPGDNIVIGDIPFSFRTV